LFVHRLEGKEGSKVTFDNVLLLDNGSKVTIGTPTVKGASIQAKILQHVKDNKVIVFKKKRRKGYQVKNGHRQALTEILIEKVNEKSAVKKADVKAEAKKPVAKKAATKKPAAKKSAANSTKK